MVRELERCPKPRACQFRSLRRQFDDTFLTAETVWSDASRWRWTSTLPNTNQSRHAPECHQRWIDRRGGEEFPKARLDKATRRYVGIIEERCVMNLFGSPPYGLFAVSPRRLEIVFPSIRTAFWDAVENEKDALGISCRLTFTWQLFERYAEIALAILTFDAFLERLKRFFKALLKKPSSQRAAISHWHGDVVVPSRMLILRV